MTDCCGLFWILSEAAKSERIAFAPIGLPPSSPLRGRLNWRPIVSVQRSSRTHQLKRGCSVIFSIASLL
jgi:hypothetical protein